MAWCVPDSTTGAQTANEAARQEPIAQQRPQHRSESQEVLVAALSGGYAVPAVATHATGTAEVTLVGSQLHYQVHVDSISDVTGAYLHIGRAGEAAPAVADLFQGVKSGPVSGLLSNGALRAADLHGTTMPRLIEALKQDEVYVTVHTLRHQPGGELRGQLRLQPTVASR